MTNVGELKTSITGLLGFAAAEEQVLLTGRPDSEDGSPEHWAAVPLIAHNTDFKSQQVHRLTAISNGQTPEDFAEVDHSSDQTYRRYSVLEPGLVAADSMRVTSELIDGLRVVSGEDLFDPSRNPWLKGRQLWLQIVVRGFWHPTGHLADYYLGHDQPDRAVAMATHAVAWARYLGVPDAARGMASYNLACAQAQAGSLQAAADAAREAVALNPELRGKIGTDPDLAPLRDSGILDPAGVI